MTKSFKLAALLPGLLLLALPSSAVDRFWDRSDGGGDPESGSFGTAGNWAPVGVPGDDDWIILDREAPTPYTITLDQDRVLNDTNNDTGLTVETDQVIFDLNGHDFTLGADQAEGTRNLLLGNSSGVNSVMVIQGGGTFLANNIAMGDADNSDSTLTVQGTNTVLNFASTSTSVSDTARFAEGNSNVTLNIIDNGLVRFDNPRANFGANSNGNVTVNVSGGGTLDTTGGQSTEGLFLARAIIHGTATLNLGPGGTLLSDGMFTARRGTAVINIDGGEAISGNALHFSRRSELTTVLIENGGTWTAPTLFAGSQEAARWNPRVEITVTGAGSKFELTNNANLGQVSPGTDGDPEFSYLTVADGGEFIVASDLNVRFSSRITIADGLVQANNLNVSDGVGSDFAEYVLTLGTYSDQTAPFRLIDDGGGSVTDLNEGNFIFSLELEPGFSPQEDDVFGVLRYEGLLEGTFKDLPQGAAFWVGNIPFEIDYGEFFDPGTSQGFNDIITLTVIPEPGTLALVMGTAGLLLLHRRRVRP